MFTSSIGNAWPLSLLFFMLGVLSMGLNQDVAKRMADMTGYSAKEKFVAIAASMAPYPFLIATLWTPFTDLLLLLWIGISLYTAGMVFFALSLRVMIQTPPDKPFYTGPYRFTRNPMYVSATIVLIGICLATASLMLAGYLVVAVLLQHFMILAEERVCKQKYGTVFENYLKNVPRYLFL